MWIFLNNAMLSVVAHRTKPRHFMVRARLAGDLERIFPRAKVSRSPSADYLWRCTVTKQAVYRAVGTALGSIDYDNFKGSIHGDPDRSTAYSGCWSVMLRAQDAQDFRSRGGPAAVSSTRAGSVWNQEDFWAEDEAGFQRQLREQLDDAEDDDRLPGGME